MKRVNFIEDLGRAMMDLSNEQILFHQAIADSLDLNITDHKCVNLISRFGPMTAGKLAELTGLTTGAITGVIDRLEKGGYAKRKPDPRDRRVTIIELTKKGVTIRKIFSPLVKNMGAVLEVFSDKELSLILKFVKLAAQTSREATKELRKNSKRP